MKKTIAVLPGDGIGPEVMSEALRVLERVASKRNHEFEFHLADVGGAAFDAQGSHFPDTTLEICRSADAILFGSVGGPIAEAALPKWKNCEANSILALRRAFQFNANYRPARVYSCLSGICPLRPELLKDGVDMLILRELVDDIYFGEHRRYEEGGIRHASDLAHYDEESISSIAELAFQAAQKRSRKLHSVDKANVLDTSRLWREVVSEIAPRYPDVELEHMLVDNCAMQIIRNPAQFDVIVTANLFGDILSDAAAVLPGSLGLTPSASLNASGFGMYEPSGGSAPDIAGQGVANPIAQILSAAMMLKFSFGLREESEAIEKAVEHALEDGFRTADIAGSEEACSCPAMTEAILERLEWSN